ncbi:MAG: hypothetical protein KDB24_17375, partial [Microthrixaceae bacterium]|nr:hypothetical protein [Microthrixaceae bacterium]
MSARNDHDPTPPQDSTSSRRQRRSSARAADELSARLEILSQVVALADDRLDPTAAEHARHALEAAR